MTDPAPHPELVAMARGWVSDCQWREHESGVDPAEDFEDHEIVRGVQRHYVGGWAQFVEDTGWEAQR